jgi:serine protease Do
VSDEVNKKVVKLFGSGGYQGLASYGSGILVSPDGYILTVSSQMLNTPELRVHLWDGTRLHAKIIAAEPELDLTLLKITEKVDELAYFDVPAAVGRPLTEGGTGVLAFSNQFKIATQDEPVSVQRGVIAAYAKLHGRRGVYDATYAGDVYFIDAITNNPGAAGGALTTRRGDLVGILGREIRNTLTDTWINYALPIQAKAEAVGEPKRVVTIADLVNGKEAYKPAGNKDKNEKGLGAFHGIVLVPNVVERTPPYIEEVQPNSPASRAGLKADDLIVYVDGDQVVSVKEFMDLIDKVRPGTDVKLEVRRGDTLTSIVIKVEAPKKKS